MSKPNGELTDYSATELAALIRSRALSPVEVISAYLARIERINPLINAYVTLTAEQATAEAKLAEQMVMSTPAEALGPLHGVPISIKDLTPTAGVRTTFGSPAFADFIPEVDAEIVVRLRRAGAISLGKTNTPEFGLHGTTEESLFGPTHNPWRREFSPGGSSGGAAAALAARLCPLAEGSDGGGSIRGPASACGVVGLKPARGRVPAAPFAGAPWAGLATSGPMARTVADVALGLDVMAGPALGDPFPTPLPDRSFAAAVGEEPGRLRIGWSVTTPVATATPEVAAAVAQTAESLRALGHELIEAMPDTSGMWEPFLTIIDAHTAAIAVPVPDLLLPHARAVYTAGQRLTATAYLAAELAIYHTTRRIRAWFEEYDLLLCPTFTRTPPRLGEMAGAGMAVWDKLRTFIPFEFWVNMAGLPGISLPLGWSPEGLPIGVQLVGRPLAERTLIAVSAQLEAAMEWRDRRPPLDDL